MLTEKCPQQPAKALDYPFTYDAIQDREGVYQAGGHTSRIIVVRFANGSNPISYALYYEPKTGLLEPAVSKTWASRMFRRTDEVLCLGLKVA